MTESTTQIPTEPPVADSEVDTLVGSLERQRRTFGWKCGGLDAAGLRATTAATTMTLGGLLREAIDGLVGEDPPPAMDAPVSNPA